MKKVVAAVLLAAGLVLGGAPMAAADDEPREFDHCHGAGMGIMVCDLIRQTRALESANP